MTVYWRVPCKLHMGLFNVARSNLALFLRAQNQTNRVVLASEPIGGFRPDPVPLTWMEFKQKLKARFVGEDGFGSTTRPTLSTAS